MLDSTVPGKERLNTQTQLSLTDMELCDGEGLVAPLLSPPVDDKALTQAWEALQNSIQKLEIMVWDLKAEKEHKPTLSQTLMEVKRAIDKQEHGSQNFKWMRQHTDYLRGQLTDTIKWRLQQHHSEVLKDIHGVMSPMVATISQLQEEMTACSLQLHSTVVKQQTLLPPHLTLSTTTAQTAHLSDSPELPHMAKTCLRLQSTCNLVICRSQCLHQLTVWT